MTTRTFRLIMIAGLVMAAALVLQARHRRTVETVERGQMAGDVLADLAAGLERGAMHAEKNAAIFRDVPTARSYFLGQRDAYLDAAERTLEAAGGSR